jgi:phosphoribosylformimino-5-aminoimidazole carboxamide ribotide isomerase
MRIIPAMDIINGQCVRLSQGRYDTAKTYHNNPLEVAKLFEDKGIQYLHLVDLDGAKSGQIVNHKTLEQISGQTRLHVDFGGGIKTESDIQTAFEAGAAQVNIGTVAFLQPACFLAWLHRFGAEKIILSADAKHRKIATEGWLSTGDSDVVEYIAHYQKLGIKYTVCTDISKDGMLNGPAIELYREILTATSVELIASGGVTTLQDVQQLESIGCEAVIIGKALYEGHISLTELSQLC